MGRVKKTDFERKLFGGMFTEALDNYKRKTGKSNDEVATDLKTSRGSIQKWCVGENIPQQKTISLICEKFGLKTDYFKNPTYDQLHRYSTMYMDEVSQDHVIFATKKSLNLDLVKALTELVDFDTLFPIYSPINKLSKDPKTGEEHYDRNVNFANSQKLDNGLDFMQLKRNGQIITMHDCDLSYLKNVQDQLIQYVEFLFFKRVKEMQIEVERFNEDRAVKSPEGNIIEYIPITKEFYYTHDSYAQYVDDGFLPIERKATQQDIDNYFGHGIKKRGK